MHQGFALLDVISPCVTFNDHEGSTKSYAYTREHFRETVHTDFIPRAQEITVEYEEGTVVPVELHDGSRLLLRKVAADYDPKDRGDAISYIQHHHEQGEIITGLLYLDEHTDDLHATSNTIDEPLNQIPYGDLSPGAAALEDIFRSYR
jgi:2-oxoglutarate ferredoxin oxidoreductase subunit beta